MLDGTAADPVKSLSQVLDVLDADAEANQGRRHPFRLPRYLASIRDSQPPKLVAFTNTRVARSMAWAVSKSPRSSNDTRPPKAGR